MGPVFFFSSKLVFFVFSPFTFHQRSPIFFGKYVVQSIYKYNQRVNLPFNVLAGLFGCKSKF